MPKVTLYDPTKTYIFSSGSLATPEEVLKQFPASHDFPFVIDTDENEQVLLSMDSLPAMRALYEIDPAISDKDAIAVISDIRNAPPPDLEVSVEERIAAALELQNLLSL